MTDSFSEPPVHLRKQDWAYDRLRHWIAAGELPAGSRVDQDSLAERLGISRVPLRQALVRLQSEGLVDQRPHRGWYVAQLDIDDARDVYAGRAALESMLTGRAARVIAPDEIAALEDLLEAQGQALANQDVERARKFDRAFHDQIFQSTGLERSCAAQRSLRGIADRYVAMYMSEVSRAVESMAQHHAILDALRAADDLLAARLAGEHVATGIALLESLLVPEEPPHDLKELVNARTASDVP